MREFARQFRNGLRVLAPFVAYVLIISVPAWGMVALGFGLKNDVAWLAWVGGVVLTLSLVVFIAVVGEMADRP